MTMKEEKDCLVAEKICALYARKGQKEKVVCVGILLILVVSWAKMRF